MARRRGEVGDDGVEGENGTGELAAVWIPAFAGMTGVEGGNDGVKIGNNGAITGIFAPSAITASSRLRAIASNSLCQPAANSPIRPSGAGIW